VEERRLKERLERIDNLYHSQSEALKNRIDLTDVILEKQVIEGEQRAFKVLQEKERRHQQLLDEVERSRQQLIQQRENERRACMTEQKAYKEFIE